MTLELYHGGPGANSLKVLLALAEKNIGLSIIVSTWCASSSTNRSS